VIGNESVASGAFAFTGGYQATASGAESIAIGHSAQAIADGSVAIGQGSVADQANTVSVGASGSERRIVNVAAGVASTDAVNMGQLNTLGSSVLALQGNTALLFDLAEQNQADIRTANEGVAMAMAMESPAIPAGAHVAVSGGVGYWRNRAALAAAVSLAVGQMSSVSAGVGFGFNSSHVGARAGFQAAW
jgi:autotransporter adhesin